MSTDSDLHVGTAAGGVRRAGGAADPTSITPYDLYAFEATLNESGGQHTTAWAALDDSIAQFPDDKRERAVFTDPTTGLDDAAIAALRALLSADRGPR